MEQLSFFSADLAEPAPGDLAGLLAAHGQLVTAGHAVRVSVLVADLWRATAIAELVTRSGIEAEVVTAEEGRPLVRTAPDSRLVDLARAWTRGAVKTVPPAWAPPPRALRAWALAAGRTDEAGYALGLDPHAPDTHQGLAAALSRVGVAATLLGPRGGGPALRVSGRRRLLRLVEWVGQCPDDPAAPASWPAAPAPHA
ncbi:hypothetical protein GCM10027047_35980 [Rhodococcus aerolatus]